MKAALELHVALSLRLDAIEAYRLAHAYRDEELLKAAARIEDAACDADFTESRDYCTGLRAGGELLTQLACGEKTTGPAAEAEVLPKADVIAAMASKIERGAVRPNNLRMLPADFFQPGRTYEAHHGAFEFQCKCVTTLPGTTTRIALGIARRVTDGNDWHPASKCAATWETGEWTATPEEATDAPSATATPFFQAGHTYTREHHGHPIEFRVRSVDTSPGDGYRVAFGFRLNEDGDWEPTDSDDLTGWTDVTDGGDR